MQRGQSLFSVQCGFCHGRDAAGGEAGPDLTSSELVAKDIRGNEIGPVVRAGRIDKGMPLFNLNDADLAAIVAFIHDQKIKITSKEGRRRAVFKGADFFVCATNANLKHAYFDLIGFSNTGSFVLDDPDLLGSWKNCNGFHLFNDSFFCKRYSADLSHNSRLVGGSSPNA